MDIKGQMKWLYCVNICSNFVWPRSVCWAEPLPPVCAAVCRPANLGLRWHLPVDSSGISREVKRFLTFSWRFHSRKNGRAFAYEGLLCAFFSLWEINNSGILFGFWGSLLYLRPIGFPTGKHRILVVNLWLMPLAWGLPLPPPSGNRRAREIALKFSFTVPVS